MICCEGCSYYKYNHESRESRARDPRGWCRRFPPVPYRVEGDDHRAFPRVNKDDYCGEHPEFAKRRAREALLVGEEP